MCIRDRDKEALVAFAKEKNIDLAFVAPDDPLAAGLVDAFQAAGIRAFGPNAKDVYKRQLMHLREPRITILLPI